MRNNKSVLFLGLILVPVYLWFFLNGESPGSSGLASPGATSEEDELERAGLPSEVLAGSNRHEGEGEEPIKPPEEECEPGAGEGELPVTGVIHGNIVDSFGAHLSFGRVFVLANQGDYEPIMVLDLEGPDMEFRCELLSGEDYWLFVDPDSLGGEFTPALSRSRKRGKRADSAQSDRDKHNIYARQYVFLEPGAEERIDVRVGKPARAYGRLLEWDGTPTAGALAQITAMGRTLSGLGENCLTDERGMFSFEDVFPGGYRLKFSALPPFNPPLPVDVVIPGGGAHDFGDIHTGGGQKTIRGVVLNQDGDPLAGLQVLCYYNQPVADGVPPHNMGSELTRATTDEDGVFELLGLESVPVKVGLTSAFEPRRVGGAGSPAIWEPPLEIDLTASLNTVDVGTHVVQESRPFTIEGQLFFDESWLAKSSNGKRSLRGFVSAVEGQSLPEGVRRVSLGKKSIELDLEANTYRCLVETPMTEIEIRFRLAGHEDLVYVVQPTALGEWSREIRIPADFGE